MQMKSSFTFPHKTDIINGNIFYCFKNLLTTNEITQIGDGIRSAEVKAMVVVKTHSWADLNLQHLIFNDTLKAWQRVAYVNVK